ncbi:MAG: hypothetical protein ACE5JN_13230 [Candidatus Methylomirabilia bacterium]
MKKFIIGMAMVAFAATPALAFECPLLHNQMQTAVGNRSDATAKKAKALAAEAWALHRAGKHAQAVAKYDEAAKAAGITLKHRRY